MVPVATICFEAQLIRRAFRHNELELDLLLQDGAVVAEQVFTEQRGEEKVNQQKSNTKQLQHVRPASRRERPHQSSHQRKMLALYISVNVKYVLYVQYQHFYNTYQIASGINCSDEVSK